MGEVKTDKIIMNKTYCVEGKSFRSSVTQQILCLFPQAAELLFTITSIQFSFAVSSGTQQA
jgi:hypothetical protein